MGYDAAGTNYGGVNSRTYKIRDEALLFTPIGHFYLQSVPTFCSKNCFAHFSNHSFHCTFIMISMATNFYVRALIIITNSQTSRAGFPHTASCFPSHAIMAHRLEFFDGAYVTKIYVYVSLG